MPQTVSQSCFLSINPSLSASSAIPAIEDGSSQLDTSSTSVQPPFKGTYRDYKLRGKFEEYQAVFEAYDSLYKVKHTERLSKCRQNGVFYRHKETGQVRVSSTSCNVRGCPMCAAARSSRVAKATRDYLEGEPDAKFLTLTMKHNDNPLEEQIRHLVKSFRNFRRTAKIKSSVRGGFWFMEFKLGKDDKWHIHLHCLVVSHWIAKEELSLLWLQSTGESMIIDIRRLKDAKTAADYAAKYASKPAELRCLPLDYRQQIIIATKNVRTYGTWGKFRKAKLFAKPVFNPNAWQRLGSWLVVSRLASCDIRARTIWQAWKTGEPVDASCDVTEYDSFIDNLSSIPPNPQNVEVESPLLF